jgi:hypothetical protein
VGVQVGIQLPRRAGGGRPELVGQALQPPAQPAQAGLQLGALRGQVLAAALGLVRSRL